MTGKQQRKCDNDADAVDSTTMCVGVEADAVAAVAAGSDPHGCCCCHHRRNRFMQRTVVQYGVGCCVESRSQI